MRIRMYLTVTNCSLRFVWEKYSRTKRCYAGKTLIFDARLFILVNLVLGAFYLLIISSLLILKSTKGFQNCRKVENPTENSKNSRYFKAFTVFVYKTEQ